jgi:predicted permease
MFLLKDMIIGDGADGLWVLMGAVILVLLVACTNIAGLFLVRATERRREIGVRRALGAGRDRLVLQQMTESIFLALLGGVAGWALAVVGMKPVLSLMPRELPRIGEMTVDSGLLFTSMGFALLTGLLTGLLPALRAARTPITTVLQEGGRSLTGGRSLNRTQMVLVVSQIALAFVLVSAAGLFIRSMSGLLSVDPGFDAQGLALANVSFPAEVETWEEAQIYFGRLEDAIRRLPGVVDVGAADQMPFSGGWSAPPVTIDGPDGERDTALHCPTVTPSYFSTMGIPVISGRGLSDTDTQGSEPVVVVSQALADRITPGASPLGYRIRVNSPDSIWRTIVGVVGDVRYRLDFARQVMAYIPSSQDPTYLDNWVIRTTGDPMALAAAFREIRTEIDPEGTHLYQDLQEVIHSSVAVVSARFSVLLLGSLAALAAFLALFGIYGVLSYLVQMNSRAIGIQVALGAERRQVIRSVLARGVVLAAFGLGIGIPLALILGRILGSQLFGVKPWDPLSLGVSGILLMVATVAASWIPGRRAAGLDPVEVLRGE